MNIERLITNFTFTYAYINTCLKNVIIQNTLRKITLNTKTDEGEILATLKRIDDDTVEMEICFGWGRETIQKTVKISKTLQETPGHWLDCVMLLGDANPRIPLQETPAHWLEEVYLDVDEITVEEIRPTNFQSIQQFRGDIENLQPFSVTPTEEPPVKSESQQNQKYDASIYYVRISRADHPELDPDHKDVFYSTRLHDININTMPDIIEAYQYTKEEIFNPCEALQLVFDKRFISHKQLEWFPLLMTSKIDDEKPIYESMSKPFVTANGDQYSLKIRIFAEKKEKEPRGLY